MSDLKRECPACGSWTTSVGIAFRDGDECPYCGLPADTADLIDKAREKGLSKKLTEALAAAEVRAVKAETERAEMASQLARIRSIVGESH